MVVFGMRKNGSAIFTYRESVDFFPGSLLSTLDIQEKGIVFAFPDIRENEILTITLPAVIAQELYATGRLKFKK